MFKELIAGVSVADGCAHFGLLESRGAENKLLHLQEYAETSNDELWYLEPLLESSGRLLKKVSKVSVALDNASTVLHSFPMDLTLGQSEQTDHIHWELANFIPGYQPKDYICDVHLLQKNAREGVANLLVVAAKRSLVANIQSALNAKKYELYVTETSYFAAEAALQVNYPEVKGENVALVCAGSNRLDIGLEAGGNLLKYAYATDSTAGSAVKIFREQIGTRPEGGIYFCGPAVSSEMMNDVRELLGAKAILLNPFRRMMKTSSYRGFDVFTGLEHRFAASIGVALMRQ